jgi:hypothetical protein
VLLATSNLWAALPSPITWALMFLHVHSQPCQTYHSSYICGWYRLSGHHKLSLLVCRNHWFNFMLYYDKMLKWHFLMSRTSKVHHLQIFYIKLVTYCICRLHHHFTSLSCRYYWALIWLSYCIHVQVFWFVTPCSGALGYRRLGGLHLENGGTKALWNVGILLQHLHGIKTQKTLTWIFIAVKT